MVARSYASAEQYRYGYGTQEKDSEIGEGIYTAEYWQYDSRLGRRWNVDPVGKAFMSTYACFNNNPIYFIDPLGLKPEDPANGRYKHSSGEYQNYKNGRAVDSKGTPIDPNSKEGDVTEELLSDMHWEKVIEQASPVDGSSVNHDDMRKEIHTDLDPSGLSGYDNLRLNKTSTLESQFKASLYLNAGEDGSLLANRFISGTGVGVVWPNNSSLSQAVEAEEKFIEFSKRIEKEMIDWYESKFSLSDYQIGPVRSANGNLNFTGDSFYLSAMLGGTQGVEVKMTYVNYEYHFKYTIIDVFGADRDDVESAKSALPGLVQMYILQKERGGNGQYTPFKNYVVIQR